MTRVSKSAARAALVLGICVSLSACGDSGSSNADSADGGGGGVCGTHANPGVLKVNARSPALGSTVVNHAIVHGFVVVNAPAIFTNFELNYGNTHTAGLSTPANPTFQVTVSGSDLIYQLTVDGWSHAPGHVELVASGGYDTTKGCTWVFPSPLFSYDVTPALDAGAGEAKGASDGGASSPYDGESSLDGLGVLDGAGTVDAPGALDAPDELDVPLALDVPSSAEVSGGADGGVSVTMDAALDSAPALDVGID